MPCGACQSIFETSERQGSHHQTIDDFRHAIESSCSLCFVVLRDARETAQIDLLSSHHDQKPFSYYKIDGKAPPHRLVISINDIRDTGIKESSSHGRLTSSFSLVDLERTKLSDVFSSMHADMSIDLVKKALSEMSSDHSEMLPSNTSHPSVANRALEWLNKCLETHKICEQDRNKDWHPPRLLDLTGYEPRLVLREDQPQGSYAALSHCWGRNPSFITLTADNLEDMRRKVPQIELPKNFRDGIQIARQLGIKYLWIDSLCILQSGQGANEDWLWHATVMRDVYANCLVNIAADRAVNAECGLFAERNPTLVKPCVMHWREYDSRPHVIVDGRLNDSGYFRSPLAHRGWTLQERLLSPRIIHYGSQQILWECRRQLNVCETYPEGFPCDMPFFTCPTIFSVDSKSEDSPISVSDHAHYYWMWHAILAAYSVRELSQPWDDKLVALAGIAQRIAILLGDDYVVGFFRSHLPQSLLWSVPEAPINNLFPRRPTSRYRAPTWSWASMDGHLIPSGNPLVGEVLTQVVDVKVDLVDMMNPFGQVKYAQITLMGPLIMVPTQSTNPRSNLLLDISWQPRYDDSSTGHKATPFALAILARASTIECLLLSPVEEIKAGRSKNIYTRLGVISVRFRGALDAFKAIRPSEVVII